MIQQQSVTIVGLLVIILGFIFDKFGIPIAPEEIETTLAILIQIAGWVITFIGRIRQGDINIIGQKKLPL